jgi:hypothetical protein
MKYFFLLFTLFSFSCKAQTITPENPKDYIGKKATVCGLVYGSYHATRVNGQPTLLTWARNIQIQHLLL